VAIITGINLANVAGGALLKDNMPDFGTFAIGPTDAWERYPSPNAIDANGRNRSA